jgi:hypothetical protein
MPGDLTGADQNHLPMSMSEYFTPGIIDTLRAEYFERFTYTRIRDANKTRPHLELEPGASSNPL